ncbi:MAG: YccF domain-containing protein, partial [Solirubrobacterales bacterium]
MRVLGNIIWLVFGGLLMAIGYLIAALIMFILIITIPFGLQALKMASFTLWPFGRTLVKRETAGAPSLIGNILWLILCGWWLA